jgi:hypothetical protein
MDRSCSSTCTIYSFARLIATLDKVEADTVLRGIATEEECSRWRDVVRQIGKMIPDAFAFAVFIPGTFNLIG